MIVKIGEDYFSSKDQPIMVVIDMDPKTDNHITSLNSMDGHKYCEYPLNIKKEKIKEFMELIDDA